VEKIKADSRDDKRTGGGDNEPLADRVRSKFLPTLTSVLLVYLTFAPENLPGYTFNYRLSYIQFTLGRF
jgi:hypothetical protein